MARSTTQKATTQAAAAESQPKDETEAPAAEGNSPADAPSEDTAKDVTSTGGVQKPEGEDTSGNADVTAQRDEEAEAKAERLAKGEAQNDEEAALLAAAPGGQRTALTDGGEGSTTVSKTAANRRPASGPLDAPQAGVENLDASDNDPDNRVYGDEAGPRDEESPEPAKARYVDADGNALSAEEIFEKVEGKTFAVTKVRVYEVFVFPNSDTEGKRLAYVAGKRVPLGEVQNVSQQISVHAQIS